jgi:hypothetical protein
MRASLYLSHHEKNERDRDKEREREREREEALYLCSTSFPFCFVTADLQIIQFSELVASSSVLIGRHLPIQYEKQHSWNENKSPCILRTCKAFPKIQHNARTTALVVEFYAQWHCKEEVLHFLGNALFSKTQCTVHNCTM